MLRMLSGTPFTIQDQNFDTDQNGILFDPLPAGTYSGTAPGSLQNVENKGGRNGARGPGFVQLDLRAGYRAGSADAGRSTSSGTCSTSPIAPTSRTRAATAANTADFLRLNALVATSGLPRQFQLGVRFGF